MTGQCSVSLRDQWKTKRLNSPTRKRAVRRTPLIAIGVVLVLFGAVALIWKNVGYTQRETVAALGPVNVTAVTRKSMPLSPILGGIALAGDVVVITEGARKS